MRIVVVGAGWSGLACAVRAVQAGHRVSVLEMAPLPGGRARSDADGDALDNGQHILLAGYARTLDLMRTVDVDPTAVFERIPLALLDPDGDGIAWPAGRPPALAAALALWRARGLGAADKRAVLRLALDWRRRGFDCGADLSVEALVRPHATPAVRARLIDPLCLSALNTPPENASAAVFLAVVRDSLFGARGSSDVLLPRAPLASLLPTPALHWLAARGATVQLRSRVTALEPRGAAWLVHAEGRDGGSAHEADRLVLACTATEAARLAAPWAPDWAARTRALQHEPIATLHVLLPRRDWPRPMLALPCDARHPAQFAFRIGPAEASLDRVALVVSAASAWLQEGAEGLKTALLAQVQAAFRLAPDDPLRAIDLRIDRRATFRCIAGQARPDAVVAPGLRAAGDYIAGPYPATLESAVRSGEAAARD